MTIQLPANLSETINSLGTVAKALEEEIRVDRAARDAELAAERVARDELLQAESAQRRREARRLNALLAAIAVLALVIAGLSVYSRYVGNQSQHVIATIESCTSTEGECAQRSQRQTEAAVGRLIAMVVEIESCGRESSDVEYRRCTDGALARFAVAPVPSPVPVPSR